MKGIQRKGQCGVRYPRPAGLWGGLAECRWLALVVMLLCLGGVFSDVLLPLLRYDRSSLARHEWWRLAAAHVVHVDWRHGMLNAAALLLTVWAAGGRVTILEWLLLVLVSALSVDAGLFWLSPEVGWYAGASGVLHGLFAGAGVILALRSRDPAGFVMLALLAVKLAFEQLSGGGSLLFAGEGVPVITDAHLYGAIGGLLTGAIISVRGIRRRQRGRT